jgi:hypothetical protein
MEDHVLQRTNELMQEMLLSGARWGTAIVNPLNHVSLCVQGGRNSLDGDNLETYDIYFRAPLAHKKELTPMQKQDVKNGMRFPEPSFPAYRITVYVASMGMIEEARAQLEVEARKVAFEWDNSLEPVKNRGCPRVSKNALSQKTIDLVKKLATGGRCRAVNLDDNSRPSGVPEAEALQTT